MDIGSLPTDTLHKFLAVLGLVITGISAYLPYRALQRIRSLIHDLRAEIAAISSKQREHVELLSIELAAPSPSEERLRALHKDVAQSRTDLAVYETKLAACRGQMTETWLLGCLMVLGLLIGAGLMSFGFTGWFAAESSPVTP